ncbi:hypothetical protein H4219_003037 [Mycoemilia scoparia]|uniref:HMG box domain-containing protein n=1 Tax=Mycoemilia scoparia TaxID=417184 RepID=A0A9W8DND6_9FUNG|nr:hypothetical protein H4219_003037 [Mycoemilia scoparia]
MSLLSNMSNLTKGSNSGGSSSVAATAAAATAAIKSRNGGTYSHNRQSSNKDSIGTSGAKFANIDQSNPSFTLSDLASLSPFSNNRNSIFRVVIIGGSFGGIHAAKELERQCTSRQLQITVIEKRDKYYYNPAALRAVAYPQIIPWLWLPYDHIFNKPKNRVIQGSVGAVLPEQVVLTDGRVFPYDVLCVATGSEYPKPSKMDTPSSLVGMSEQFDFARKVKEADSILVIGGGATGVEMAGEIAAAYPKKEVTIVHKCAHLLNGEGNAKFWNRLYKELESMGVNIILNERVIIPEDDPLTYEIHPRWMKTTSGREIFSDLQFLCSGIQTRSEFMFSLVPNQVERIINPQTGEIKVRPTLQIAHPDFPNIFSAGDCTNIPGQKLAGKADSMGKHVGACIAKMFKAWKKGRENWKHISLPTWEDPTYRISISLGSQGGITHTPWILLGSWATRFIKSKDLFLLKRYREFGLYYDPQWRKMVEEDHDPFGAPAWCPPVSDQDYLEHLSQAIKNGKDQDTNVQENIVAKMPQQISTPESEAYKSKASMISKSVSQNFDHQNPTQQLQQLQQLSQQMQQMKIEQKKRELELQQQEFEQQRLEQQRLQEQMQQHQQQQQQQQFQPVQLRQVYIAPDGTLIDPSTMTRIVPQQQQQQVSQPMSPHMVSQPMFQPQMSQPMVSQFAQQLPQQYQPQYYQDQQYCLNIRRRSSTRIPSHNSYPQSTTSSSYAAPVSTKAVNGGEEDLLSVEEELDEKTDSHCVMTAQEADDVHKQGENQLQQQEAEEYEREEKSLKEKAKLPPSFLSSGYNRLSEASFLDHVDLTNDPETEVPATVSSGSVAATSSAITTADTSAPMVTSPVMTVSTGTAGYMNAASSPMVPPTSQISPIAPDSTPITPMSTLQKIPTSTTGGWIDDDGATNGSSSTLSFPGISASFTTATNSAVHNNGVAGVIATSGPYMVQGPSTATIKSPILTSFTNNTSTQFPLSHTKKSSASSIIYSKNGIQQNPNYQLPKGYTAHLEPASVDINANLYLSNQLAPTTFVQTNPQSVFGIARQLGALQLSTRAAAAATTTTKKKTVKKTKNVASEKKKAAPGRPKPTKKKDPTKKEQREAFIKEPKKSITSAYIAFFKDQFKNAPEVAGSEGITAYSGAAAQKWRQLSEHDKEPYVKKFNQAKKEYENILRDWWKTVDMELVKLENARRKRYNANAKAEGKSKLKLLTNPFAPKRPPTAFSIFIKEKYSDASHDAPRSTSPEILKTLAGKWKTLNDAEKNVRSYTDIHFIYTPMYYNPEVYKYLK